MLSESVGKALQLFGGEEASETAKFALMFDRFFDCLNVSSLTGSAKKRKLFRMPYRRAKDFRLSVSCVCNEMSY